MAGYELLQLLLACAAAGALAALLGLGGGIFVVPILTLWKGVPLVQATAASLVCCLATSAGGSVAFDKAKLADFRLVAHLEVFAALGALGAAYVGAKGLIPPSALYGMFTVVVGYAAARMLRRELLRMREDRRLKAAALDSSSAQKAGDGTPADAPPADAPPADAPPADAPTPATPTPPGADASSAPVPNYPLGFALAGLAGVLSGLLGIGGGPVKVPLQTEVLHVPLRVALANANLMIGITTGFGAAVHFGLGTIDPLLTAPCALGMAGGAYLGGRLAPKIKANWLALAFVAVLTYVAVRMAWKALTATS